MNIDTRELEEFINSSLRAIKNGSKGTGFEVKMPVEFDLAVANTAEGSGGLKIFIAKAEGKLKSEEISHIKFEVQPERYLGGDPFPSVKKINPAR